jgi:holo-[acyl-carrier protein] synthase
MILGIGTDIVDITRITAIYERHGKRFLERCFTPAEQALIGTDMAALARRYAAKEAASKALGTGIGEDIGFHDLEILRNDRGQPVLRFSAKAERYIKDNLCSAGSACDITPHVSLSDEPPYAVAYVVVEA